MHNKFTNTSNQNLFYCNDVSIEPTEDDAEFNNKTITAIINREPQTDDIIVVTMACDKYFNRIRLPRHPQ